MIEDSPVHSVGVDLQVSDRSGGIFAGSAWTRGGFMQARHGYKIITLVKRLGLVPTNERGGCTPRGGDICPLCRATQTWRFRYILY
jgi:hypothetical protein